MLKKLINLTTAQFLPSGNSSSTDSTVQSSSSTAPVTLETTEGKTTKKRKKRKKKKKSNQDQPSLQEKDKSDLAPVDEMSKLKETVIELPVDLGADTSSKTFFANFNPQALSIENLISFVKETYFAIIPQSVNKKNYLEMMGVMECLLCRVISSSIDDKNTIKVMDALFDELKTEIVFFGDNIVNTPSYVQKRIVFQIDLLELFIGISVKLFSDFVLRKPENYHEYIRQVLAMCDWLLRGLMGQYTHLLYGNYDNHSLFALGDEAIEKLNKCQKLFFACCDITTQSDLKLSIQCKGLELLFSNFAILIYNELFVLSEVQSVKMPEKLRQARESEIKRFNLLKNNSLLRSPESLQCIFSSDVVRQFQQNKVEHLFSLFNQPNDQKYISTLTFEFCFSLLFPECHQNMERELLNAQSSLLGLIKIIKRPSLLKSCFEIANSSNDENFDETAFAFYELLNTAFKKIAFGTEKLQITKNIKTLFFGKYAEYQLMLLYASYFVVHVLFVDNQYNTKNIQNLYHKVIQVFDQFRLKCLVRVTEYKQYEACKLGTERMIFRMTAIFLMTQEILREKKELDLKSGQGSSLASPPCSELEEKADRNAKKLQQEEAEKSKRKVEKKAKKKEAKLNRKREEEASRLKREEEKSKRETERLRREEEKRKQKEEEIRKREREKQLKREDEERKQQEAEKLRQEEEKRKQEEAEKLKQKDAIKHERQKEIASALKVFFETYPDCRDFIFSNNLCLTGGSILDIYYVWKLFSADAERQFYWSRLIADLDCIAPKNSDFTSLSYMLYDPNIIGSSTTCPAVLKGYTETFEFDIRMGGFQSGEKEKAELDLIKTDLTTSAIGVFLSAVEGRTEFHFFDPANGIEDIFNRQIKLIGNAEEKILTEDPTRLFRLIRLIGKFATYEAQEKGCCFQDVFSAPQYTVDPMIMTQLNKIINNLSSSSAKTYLTPARLAQLLFKSFLHQNAWLHYDVGVRMDLFKAFFRLIYVPSGFEFLEGIFCYDINYEFFQKEMFFIDTIQDKNQKMIYFISMLTRGMVASMNGKLDAQKVTQFLIPMVNMIVVMRESKTKVDQFHEKRQNVIEEILWTIQPSLEYPNIPGDLFNIFSPMKIQSLSQFNWQQANSLTCPTPLQQDSLDNRSLNNLL